MPRRCSNQNFLYSVFLLLLSLVPVWSQAGHITLRVVMDDNYPPYVFRDASGSLSGILIDEWQLWQKKTGVPVLIDAMDWNEAQRRMDAGEYQVIDTLFKTPARLQKYDFSPPHARIEVPIFFRKEIEGISGIDTLKGFPVAAKSGGATTQMLRDAGIAPLMEFPSYEAIVQAAAEGKVGVFVVDRPPALFFLYKYNIADDFRQTEPFTVGEFHRAVRKGDTATLELVNRGFAQISKAEQSAIRKRWLGTALNGERWGRQLLIGVMVLVGVLGLLGLWTLMLRRSVRIKTRALAASEARFRALFEAIPELVFRLDRNGVFRDYHAAAPEQLLLNPSEFIGRTLAETLPAEVAAKASTALEALLRVRQPQQFDYELEFPDRTRHWFEAVMSLCGDDEALVSVREITERKETEDALRSARDAAETASRAKSEFLATMSHEIRTPLNGITGMAQLLRLSPLNDRQREFLDVLEASAGNLLALINDILDLARIEAGKMQLEPQIFEPRGALEEVVAMQRYVLQQKGLALRLSFAADCPQQVRGDVLRFKQILFNLLGNAVKFTEQGEVAIMVVRAGGEDREVSLRFSVADTGIGMSEDLQQRLFHPFEQGDSALTRKYGGSGLGLSICQRLVQMMGGKIEVNSHPGKGSTFHVTLPFEVVAQPAMESSYRPLPEATTVPQKLSVLVAEDNDVNRRLLGLLLQQLGHRCVVAENGNVALEYWRREHFDLVLMDIRMPVLDGVKALERIRDEEEALYGRHQPVVALTAHAMDGHREALLAEGFDGYLAKPFGLQALSNAIEQAVQKPLQEPVGRELS